MSTTPNPHDPAWEEFFKFIELSPDEIPSSEEAEVKLRHLGIDVQAVQSRVLGKIRMAEARSKLKLKRDKLLASNVSTGASPPTQPSAVWKKIKARIDQQTKGEIQTAYFRKLETAASEADLQHLLEDLESLDLLHEGESNASDLSEAE